MPRLLGDQILGDLAGTVTSLASGTPLHVVAELFAADDAPRWLVVTTASGPALLTRAALEPHLSRRSALHRLRGSRRPISDVPVPATVVLPASCSVGEAAATLVQRRGAEDAVPEALLVAHPDGRIGVVPVATLFEQLAVHYEHRALHDPLTGLPNRLLLESRLRPPHDFRPAVLLLIDLDRFKDVNDHYGHAAGDEVLVQFAERLRTAARAGDLVARLGGDEFAVVTADRLSPAQADAMAQRVLLAAEAPLVVRGTGGEESLVSVGASVGIAEAPAGDGPLAAAAFDSLVTQADAAMYRAKSLGRGRAAHFAPELLEDREAGEAVRERQRFERRLRAAVEEGGLHLQYQPVVALPAGRVTGFEALARWHDEELGWVPPDRFIPIAEQSGLIVDLGRWVLRTACLDAARWPSTPSGATATVAVNVSAVQLGQRGFIDDVVSALEISGLEPARLCLEITETAAITDLPTTAGRLEALRRLGVRLALDDFGAGHSALTLLRSLPVDLVKIDRSFVERVTTDTADAVLVRLVIEAAHSLGRTVCAEGVETREQAVQLVAMGCDSAQGWLFGRPADEPVLATGALTALEADTAPLPLQGSDEMVFVSTPDRVITYASANIAPVLGWLPQELVGRSVFEVLHPEDAARVQSGRPLVRSGRIDGTVHRALHRNGSVRWLRTTVQRLADSTGAVREVVTVSRDVTAEVAAQEALAQSESMFRYAFDDAPIGMALTGLDGSFIRVNKAYATLVGRSPEELGQMSVADVTHPEDLSQDDVNLAEARTGAAPGHDVVKRYLRADGSAVPTRVHASVVPDRSGRPAYVFAHVLATEAAGAGTPGRGDRSP